MKGGENMRHHNRSESIRFRNSLRHEIANQHTQQDRDSNHTIPSVLSSAREVRELRRWREESQQRALERRRMVSEGRRLARGGELS
jgi:hypothetical protein